MRWDSQATRQLLGANLRYADQASRLSDFERTARARFTHLNGASRHCNRSPIPSSDLPSAIANGASVTTLDGLRCEDHTRRRLNLLYDCVE